VLAAEVAVLVRRGDELFGTGDVASARLFYERAADAGDALAVLRLGESFDPDFLRHVHVRGVQGDRGMAIIWYQRARELGSVEAEILLKNMEVNPPDP
jgi:TPR repeat protein